MLNNLLKIKSIVTLLVIGVFVYCTINGTLSAQDVMMIVTMIVTFYFAKKTGGGDSGN